MALIKNGKTYRTIEEQVGHLTDAHNEQLEINQTIESDINELSEALDGKQDTLTFDSQPIDGSTNPVESNGIYDALAGKLDKITITTTNQQAYVKAQDGTQTMVDTSTGNGANTLAKRYTNGRLSVGTPSDNNDATTKKYVDDGLSTKQNTLTFDDNPTENSSNPVKSGGIYTALSGKQNTLTFDDNPTENSSNPVKSGGVYTALSGKQNTLTASGNIKIENNTISITSGTSTPDGYQLVANGSGGSVWRTPSGGSIDVIELSGSSGTLSASDLLLASKKDTVIKLTLSASRTAYLRRTTQSTTYYYYSLVYNEGTAILSGSVSIKIKIADGTWSRNSGQYVVQSNNIWSGDNEGKVLTGTANGGCSWKTPSGGSPKYHHRINGYVMLSVEGDDYPFAVSIDFYNNVSTAYTSIADVISALITAGYTWDAQNEIPTKMCNGYIWNKGSSFNDLMAFVNISALNYGGTNYLIAYDVHETSNDAELFAAGTQTASNFLTDDVIALVG